MVAKLRGPHWALEPHEAAALSESLVAVIAYIPLPERELGIGLAVSNLAACVVTVVAQRVMYEQMMGLTSPRPTPAPAPPSAPPAPTSSQSPSQAAAEPNGRGSAADLLASISNL